MLKSYFSIHKSNIAKYINTLGNSCWITERVGRDQVSCILHLLHSLLIERIARALLIVLDKLIIVHAKWRGEGRDNLVFLLGTVVTLVRSWIPKCRWLQFGIHTQSIFIISKINNNHEMYKAGTSINILSI